MPAIDCRRFLSPTCLLGATLLSTVLCGPAPATPPPNDDCVNAIPILSDDETFTGTTIQATPDGANTCGQVPDAPSVWYSFIRNRAGTLRLNTCPSSLGTAVSVHLTCPGGPATEVACAHDCPQLCGPLNATCLTLSVNANVSYWIRIAGDANETGNFSLHAVFDPAGAPDNDLCTDAIDLPFESGAVSGSIDGAGRDGASACDTASDNVDVWYQYTAFRAGRLDLSTCPSYFNVVLSVRDGCPGNVSRELACSAGCNTGPLCGPLFNTCLSIDVAPGAAYWIRVAGTPAYSGQFSLNVNFHPTPSGDFTNDGLADGQDIQPYVRAVFQSSTSPADLAAGDFNANGVMDPADTPGMVATLLR